MQRKCTHVTKRVADTIEERIIAGAYAPERPLPPIRDLAVEQKVAAMTVQRALKLLATSGRVRSVPGVGVFPGSGRPLDAVALVIDEKSLAQIEDPMGHLRGTVLDVIAGVKMACTEEGLHFITVTEHDDPQRLIRNRTGFLLHFSDHHLTPLTRWMTALLLAKEPCVALCNDHGLPSFIDRNVPAAIEKGLRYLYGLGHRRVLLITRPIGAWPPDLKPMDGMADLELRTHVTHLSQEQGVQREMNQLIAGLAGEDAAQRITAVLAGPGNMARPVLFALVDAGLGVPGDCSLLGFCSAQHAQLEDRRISRIDNAWKTVAWRAVKELVQVAATRKDAGHVLVVPELVEADTCAPSTPSEEMAATGARTFA